MYMQKQKGFTIIELIVVIAIIAVLAAIVLVNVTQYINKSKDAAAQGNLASMLTASAIYYETKSNYFNYISGSSSGVGGQVVFSNTVGTPAGAVLCDTATKGDLGFVSTCNALVASNMGYILTSSVNPAVVGPPAVPGGTNWCACVPLKAISSLFCVDSTGNKKTVPTSTTATCILECPAASAKCQ